RWPARNSRKWDTKDRLLASVDKARELLNYTPRTTFTKSLVHTIDWFKQNQDKIEVSASFGPGMSSAVRGYK
ncbi:MAG: nucleotide sugar epimerase, partial [Firmicutes bacterium]|nr:nucleotide sugar epimerase [Bacillota bacterium]